MTEEVQEKRKRTTRIDFGKTHCKLCGKPIIKKCMKHSYCSFRCRTRAASTRRYYLVRDSLEYQTYKKEYFAKWLDKNREHFNELCRQGWHRRRKGIYRRPGRHQEGYSPPNNADKSLYSQDDSVHSLSADN